MHLHILVVLPTFSVKTQELNQYVQFYNGNTCLCICCTDIFPSGIRGEVFQYCALYTVLM